MLTSGRGFTEKEIYFGYGTLNAVSDFGKAVGINADVGDQEGMVRAVVDDINARGGIAGRKLVPIFHDVSGTAGRPVDGAQQMCARFTEDRPVFAVFQGTSAVHFNTLAACLARHQTVLLPAGHAVLPQAVYSRFAPYVYGVTTATMERLYATVAQRLAALGYFKGGWDIGGAPGPEPTKIGVVGSSQVYGEDFIRIVRQQMAKYSQTVAATYVVDNQDDYQRAVLEFREAGVTHVVPFGATIYFFSQTAESQQYRPRYALFGFSGGSVVQDSGSERQFVGSLGAGYIPTFDVDNARHPGDMGVAEARCRKLFEKADFNTSNRVSFSVMVQLCDGHNFLLEAIKHGGLSPQGLHRGGQAMGSMPPASTFGISLKDGRFDGATTVRDLAFRKPCEHTSQGWCFVYLNRTNHGM